MAQEKISLEQVRHVARLARLELAPAEEQRLQAEMSEMLGYVDKLNELDTDAVEPTAQVGESGTPMREDVVTNLRRPTRCWPMLRRARAFSSKCRKLSSDDYQIIQ